MVLRNMLAPVAQAVRPHAIPLPENNRAIDCHEKKKLPCMPVLLSSARQLTVLQGASYSAVLQGASYRAILQNARLPPTVLQGANYSAP